MTNFFYNENKLDAKSKEILRDCVIIGLCSSNRPFHILDDPGFALILKAFQQIQLANQKPFDLLHAMPHRTTCANNLVTMKEQGIEAIKEQVANLFGASLTLDHWKDVIRQQHYLASTLSYVTNGHVVMNNGSIKQETIAVTRFLDIVQVSDKSNTLVRKNLRRVIREFGLLHLHLTFTTDNALTSAFNKKRVFTEDSANSCFAHNFALFFVNAFWNEQKLQSRKKMSQYEIDNEFNDLDVSQYSAKVDRMFDALYSKARLNNRATKEIKEVIELLFTCKALVSFTHFICNESMQ